MTIKKTNLAARWATVTEILERRDKVREIRQTQASLLSGLDQRVEQRRAEIEGTLGNLPPAERRSISARTTSAFRAELRRSSDEHRSNIFRTAVESGETAKSVAAHYQSPIQMLMRHSLGSVRRGLIQQQIEASGPTELASLAVFAAGTRDLEMAAALCSRNVSIRAVERPFSSQELADAVLGSEYRTVSQALTEIQIVAREVVNADRSFVSGRSNPTEAIQIALMKQDPALLDAGDEGRATDH